MPEINKDLLLSRIRRSGDFTALEKRYLESLVELEQHREEIKQAAFKTFFSPDYVDDDTEE